MKDEDCALRVALEELHELVSREKRVALKQESDAQNCKDFRAADRHRSFAMAMQKVRNKVRDIARRNMIYLDEQECDKVKLSGDKTTTDSGEG